MEDPSREPPSDFPTGDRLDSWKEIASYLKRSVRSVQRWEVEEAMPVHRHHHEKRGTIYAFKAELDAWWKERGAMLAERDTVEEAPSPASEETVVGPHVEEPLPTTVSEPIRSVPRARRAVLIGAGFGLAVVTVALVAWLSRNGNSGRPAGLEKPLPFEARDWVLVVNFENRTREPVFDGTIEYALERELAASRFVNVVSRERVADSLRLMKKDPETRLDAALGREVSLRDGNIQALLTGRIEKLGSKYVLSVEVVDPLNGQRRASLAEEAGGEDKVPSALRRLSNRVRQVLGESPPADRGERALLEVTTPSLRALQLFSRADALMRDQKPAAAEELLTQALVRDPEFASAHILLAWALKHLKRPEGEWRRHAEEALRLSEMAVERERYFIRGSFFEQTGQQEKAVASYEALLSLHPDHYWGNENLRSLYMQVGRPREAAGMDAKRADFRPKDFEANSWAAWSLAVFARDPARAKTYVQRSWSLVSPEISEKFSDEVAWTQAFPAYEHLVAGRAAEALEEVKRLETDRPGRGTFEGHKLLEVRAQLCMGLGRLADTERLNLQIPDPFHQHELLAQVALAADDTRELRRHLEALGNQKSPHNHTAILLARAGFVSRARDTLVELEKRNFLPGYLDVVRGEISMATDDIEGAIPRLEEGTRRLQDIGYATFFLGSETLARAWEKKGEPLRAIEVLERASSKKVSGIFFHSAASWLRTQAQLADLYRRSGRNEEARRIESELKNVLAVADADHPILRQLRSAERRDDVRQAEAKLRQGA